MTNRKVFTAAREFVYASARVLEQRMFETLFEGAPATGALDALRGFRNDDGGFGHGLEPDKRCPESLPIDVEIALQAMVAIDDGDRARDDEMLTGAFDYLATVSTEDGAVALASAVIEPYPHAVHWAEWAYQPGLNPTAGLAGLGHALGVDHPWVARATEWSWRAFERQLPTDGHAVLESLVFLEHVPDRERADAVAAKLFEQLPETAHFRADADDPEYGVTPLHVAPSPSSRWHAHFEASQLDAHLDRMLRDQQADGGWALAWEPPSAAATFDYRGIETVRALRVLEAYGRLD